MNKSAKQESLVGKVVHLATLVDYQKDSVVSRTLVGRKGGTVTLFAFDQGQSLSEHSAPFDALVQVLEGEVEISLSGEPHRVKAGEMLIMPANVPHALSAISPYKMILVMIKE